MPEPFKNLLNAALIDTLASHLARVAPAKRVTFDPKAFRARASRGLDALEMKARAEHIASALEHALPEDFALAADVLDATLAPSSPSDELGDLRPSEAGIAGWIVWPLTLYVARRGHAHPVRALASLREMTQRFTAEWAVRAFIERHPGLSFATLAQWARDPSPHVRRLASEGSRPRLPWGKRLDALVRDPRPTLPLLEALRDDPSEYVRRSVANHLNDVAKDHPELFADVLEAWLADAPPERMKLLSHASRSLVKAGHPRVLRAFGLHRELEGTASLTVSPKKLVLGGNLALTLTLRSSSKKPQKLAIDYAVHHMKANGELAPKVFKGWSLVLAPGEARTLERSHAIKPITTRRYYSGRHEVECLVNGRPLGGRARFELVVPGEAKPTR